MPSRGLVSFIALYDYLKIRWSLASLHSFRTKTSQFNLNVYLTSHLQGNPYYPQQQCSKVGTNLTSKTPFGNTVKNRPRYSHVVPRSEPLLALPTRRLSTETVPRCGKSWGFYCSIFCKPLLARLRHVGTADSTHKSVPDGSSEGSFLIKYRD